MSNNFLHENQAFIKLNYICAPLHLSGSTLYVLIANDKLVLISLLNGYSEIIIDHAVTQICSVLLAVLTLT